MVRKYTRMRITHIDIYRLSLFMSGAKILLWCARALSLAHSGFSRSLSHSLGLTPRFIPRSLTRSLPPTLAHWFPYSRPEPINEENSAKEEIAEALEAARNITRLYNEMAETADNRTEAIQKPASTGNVSPFSFYSTKAGHINLPEPSLPSHLSAKELPEAAKRLLDIGTTVRLGGVPLKLPRTLPVTQMSPSPIQPPIPTASHSQSSNAVPVQAPPPPPPQPDTFVGNTTVTPVQEAEWKQLAWCYDSEYYFDPTYALYPPEDKRNTKLNPSGIEEGWAFKEVRPAEDLLQLIYEQRPQTEDPENLWSKEGHPHYDPETLEMVRTRARFPKYKKGTPWCDYELSVLEWYDNYGQHQSEQAQLENVIAAQPQEEQAKWLKLKRGRKITFFELLWRISRDGRRHTDPEEPGDEWMVMQLPEVLTPQKFADFFTLWCAAGQRVTGGVSKFRAHQQFMQVLRAHNKTGRTKGFDKVMSRINTRHAEHGKRYTYLELYCVVMPHLLTLEDVERQEARDRTREARVRAMYDGPRERRTSPYQGRTSPRRDNSKEPRHSVSNERSRPCRDSESYRYGSGEHRSGGHTRERERSKSPSRHNDRPRTPNGSRWDGNRERSNSRNRSTNTDPKHRDRANGRERDKMGSRTRDRSLSKDQGTADRDRSRTPRRGDQPRARSLSKDGESKDRKHDKDHKRGSKRCEHCKLGTHNSSECWFKFPDKAPPGWERHQDKRTTPSPRRSGSPHPRRVDEMTAEEKDE